MRRPIAGRRRALTHWMKVCLIVGAALSTAPAPVAAQSTPAAGESALESRLETLSKSVTDMQRQLTESQAEVEALKSQLETLRISLATANNQGASSPSSQETVASLQAAVSGLKDQDEVLESEIKQHEQTKLETGSKYPVQVTGLLLFSSFLNHGAVDNIDEPVLAEQRAYGRPNGSLAATMRQTILGLEATGPLLWGAKSSADLNIDFFGGLAYADYNTSAGIVRLRTGHAQLEWPRHSVIFALDKPLISPLSPTSFVSVGEPALAWSGNLWTWSPQLQLKSHSAWGRGTLNYDFALIDSSAPGPPPASGQRQPDASEQSRQPGYEFHGSYTVNSLRFGANPFTLGVGGYYSRQAYAAHQHVDAWAGSADWLLPLSRSMELSGEFYRGRALGGLGGGGFKDVYTEPQSGAVRGLNTVGGWAQWKLRLPASLEGNVAFGQDNPFANELDYSVEGAVLDPYSNLARNRTVAGNIIFRPKTYLLFTTEFRYLQSWPVTGKAQTAPIVGFAAGYLF